jgi:hypothetical protein
MTIYQSVYIVIGAASSLLQGSATACIIVLDREDLQAANLGDSGFLVIRDSKVVFRSPPQQHDFNFPFQLGSPGSQSDGPQDAEVCNMLAHQLYTPVMVSELD